MAPGEFRLRVRYAKTGAVRFLSHLEVMRALERSARRARLPYAVTKGFSPHMKIAFGPALPVGTAGLAENYDVWLSAYVPAGEALSRLRDAAPPSLAPTGAGYVGLKEPSLSAAVTLAEYEVVIEGEGVGDEAVRKALEAVIGEGRLTVEHKSKTKVFDLTRTLPKEVSVESSGSGVVVVLTTRMGQEGSLRPEVLCQTALSRARCPGAVVSVSRTRTFIEGEDGPRSPL